VDLRINIREGSCGRVLAIAIRAATALTWVALCIPLAARTIVVSHRGPVTSISAAIRVAAAGDTVEVQAGFYQENVLLDRSLQLVGADHPVIHGLGQGSVVTVAANGCLLRGFVIEHSGGMLVDEDAGVLVKSLNNRIQDNQLRDVLFGIYLLQADHNLVVGNTIHGRPLADVGDRGSGIHIWNSSYNTLERNTIFEARDGMYLQNANYSVIRENRVHDLRYGLHYMYSDDSEFEGNAFYNNVAGAAIMYSRRVRFRHNSFLHNRGFASYGVLFQADEDCTAEENLIADNAVGVFMEGLTRTEFRHNTISGNDLALRVFSSSNANLFERNNFVENLSPLEVIGSHTDNRWNGPEAGNYWSDYDGLDLDGNGIGDIPYKIQNIFEHLEAGMPLLRLYLFSPAAQSLEVAEHGFPLFQRVQETDQLPLVRPVAATWMPPATSERATHRIPALFIPLALLAGTLTVFRCEGHR
jgi:nitrous oxidase accessory protein